jgi:hypothetical protein
MSRNLLHRPSQPALGRGHIQRAALRVLLAAPYGVATTAQVLEWTCAMKRHRRRPIYPADYQIARRARSPPPCGEGLEIRTGSRTMLSYLLSPLLRYRQESLRER